MEVLQEELSNKIQQKELFSFIRTNFILTKVKSMRQPNYVDCGIYTSLNMCIVHEILVNGETKSLNTIELYEKIILDNLNVETSRLHPNNHPYNVEEVTIHRRSISDSIAKLNASYNGELFYGTTTKADNGGLDLITTSPAGIFNPMLIVIR